MSLSGNALAVRPYRLPIHRQRDGKRQSDDWDIRNIQLHGRGLWIDHADEAVEADALATLVESVSQTEA